MNPLIKRARELDALSASLQQLSDGPLMAALIARYRTLCLDLADLVEQQEKQILADDHKMSLQRKIVLEDIELRDKAVEIARKATDKYVALKAEREAVCEWTRHASGEAWVTACGSQWKAPTENKGFCKRCGHKVVVK